MIKNNFTVGYFDEPTDVNDYIECNGSYLSSSEAVELLNELYEERNYFERKKCEYWNKFNLTHLDNIDLRKENEQLQARNDRQAKQLDNLYRLIEEKDWKALTDIMDDFKECEEQLQREWMCYE